MYAVVKIKGKQYRVSVDDVIDVDLLEQEPGEHVKFQEVLIFDDGSKMIIGAPTVPNCVIEGEVVELSYGPKITSVKYKRRHNQQTKWGHRQKYSRIKVTAITSSAQKKKQKKEQEE